MAKTKKRTLLSVLAIAAASVLVLVSVGSLTACGSKETYSVNNIPNLSTSDFEFIHFSSYGDSHGIGMVNIDGWGNKKLKTSNRGTVDGTGAVWGFELDVSDDEEYALSVYCDLVGAGDVYDGECRMTYLFNGSYERSAEADDGSIEFKLEAPTYVKVTFKTDTHWDYLVDVADYDFADYLPGCNDLYQPDKNGVFFVSDSEGELWASITSPDGVPNSDFRFTPEYLCTTVFGGATFVCDTSTKAVVEVKDAVPPSDVGYI